MTKTTDDKNFDRDVLKSNVPVVVMFHASWAGPCRLAQPTFEEMAGRYGNQVAFFTFDLDDNPTIPERYGVKKIPAFYLFDEGQPEKAMAGAMAFENMCTIMDDVL